MNWMDWNIAKDPVKNAGLSRFMRLMRAFKARQPALRLSEFPNENNIRWHGHHPNEPMWDEERRGEFSRQGCIGSHSWAAASSP